MGIPVLHNARECGMLGHARLKCKLDCTVTYRSFVMGKFKALAFSFLLGSVSLCCLSTFQKILTGFPLALRGFLVPFIAGGSFGLLIGIRHYRLSKNNEQLAKEIHEHRQTEEALRKSEAKFRSLAENQHDVVWTVDKNLDIDYISPSCFKMTGKTAEEMMGANPKDFCTEESYQRIRMKLSEEIQKSPNEMQPVVLEVDQYHNDGHIFPVEITSIPIIIDNKFIGIQGISKDITEMKASEEEIRKLSTAVEQSPSVIAITDLNGNLEYVNPKFSELTGYTHEEAINNNPRILKSHEQPDEMYKELWETISSGKIWRGEFHNKKKNGELFWEAASVSPIFDKQGKITNFIKVAENITGRKLAEEALRESEEKFRLISEQSLLAIGIIQDGHIIYANEKYSKITGYSLEEIYGWEPYGYARTVCRDDLPFVMEQSRKKQAGDMDVITNYQLRGFTKAEEIVWWDLYSRTITYHGRPADLFTIVDITEKVASEKDRVALQAKLQHAQKMEAIGTLAGGVAHDLNNILGGLVSYPELLLLQLPDDSPLRKSILTIQKSGEKAAAVVQDLLTLARRGVVVAEVVNLNDIISEYLKSPEYKRLRSHHPAIHLETHLEKDVLNILGSSIHLSKTVMNLVSNAAEAMPEGGTLTVSTENRYIDKPISRHDHVKEGDYVVLTISDTGTGITSDDLEKIFEPFYTKKKMGRSGTGLGMAVVWGTVKDHDGYIQVRSTEGKGTTFTLYFPVTRKSIKERSEISLKNYVGNGETILVVDDVDEQRKITSDMLKELGYSVAMVPSGEEAVEYLKTSKVDLLVLDMIMDPGMDGLDTYKKILEVHPDQKALIASGFSETDRVKEVQGLGARAYIKKPFLLEKIGLAVKKELERQAVPVSH